MRSLTVLITADIFIGDNNNNFRVTVKISRNNSCKPLKTVPGA